MYVSAPLAHELLARARERAQLLHGHGLASSPQGGALVMAGFAIGSAPALAVAPWAWARWQALRGSAASPVQVATLGFRVAGFGLVLGSGWALTHGLWERFAAWCVA